MGEESGQLSRNTERFVRDPERMKKVMETDVHPTKRYRFYVKDTRELVETDEHCTKTVRRLSQHAKGLIAEKPLKEHIENGTLVNREKFYAFTGGVFLKKAILQESLEKYKTQNTACE